MQRLIDFEVRVTAHCDLVAVGNGIVDNVPLHELADVLDAVVIERLADKLGKPH